MVKSRVAATTQKTKELFVVLHSEEAGHILGTSLTASSPNHWIVLVFIPLASLVTESPLKLSITVVMHEAPLGH